MVWISKQLALPTAQLALKVMTVETVGLGHYQVILDDNLSAKLEVILRQEKINSDDHNPVKKNKNQAKFVLIIRLACPLAIPLSRQNQLPS